MSRFFGRLFRLPFHLVLIGVALGLIARIVYPPKTEVIAPRQLTVEAESESGQSVEQDAEEEFTDLPLK